jgi:hypothetical protein
MQPQLDRIGTALDRGRQLPNDCVIAHGVSLGELVLYTRRS